MNEVILATESAGKIEEMAVKELERPIWMPRKPNTNSQVAEFIRNLRIPLGSYKDVPLVILVKLGSFQHDQLLRKRLDRIFSPLNHT